MVSNGRNKHHQTMCKYYSRPSTLWLLLWHEKLRESCFQASLWLFIMKEGQIGLIPLIFFITCHILWKQIYPHKPPHSRLLHLSWEKLMICHPSSVKAAELSLDGQRRGRKRTKWEWDDRRKWLTEREAIHHRFSLFLHYLSSTRQQRCQMISVYTQFIDDFQEQGEGGPIHKTSTLV